MSIKVHKIGFFGDGQWALNFLKKIKNHNNFEISFICCRKKVDKKIKFFANKNKITFFAFKNINSNKNIKKITSFKCDFLVSLSYDQIFKNKILNIFKNKILNCHAGDLPKYRGRNVLNWVLINGEKSFSITIHIIDKKIDMGKLILKKKFIIKDSHTYKDLLNIANKECQNVLLAGIKLFIKQKNKYKFKKISGKGEYYKKRKNGDEIIDFSKKNIEIQNFIRALVPPGPYARLKLDDKIYKVKKSILIKQKKIGEKFYKINHIKQWIDFVKFDGKIRMYYI